MEWFNIPTDSEVRGMTGNTILYADRTFTDESVLPSGNMPRERSLLSDVLAIDSFSFDVISEDTTLVNFIRNTPLTYYHNDVQMGIFYVQKISRTSINTYRFDCTSTVGLLDESYHNGGIYTGQTVDEVVTDICSPYLVIVKNNIKSIKLYGWLPIATKRENLTQVLFAIGATLKVDYNGVIRIEGLWDSQSAEIDADHMYSGGSVEYATPVTQVIVTEHAYNQTATETVDLFEGTASAGDKITFDEPCYDLVADGFRITESGANYAIVTAGSGKLTGKKYVHTTRQVIKDIAPQTRDLVDQSDSVVKVESATLVSLANSNAVAERLVSYYSCNERIVSDVLTQSESPGDVVSIVHPYGGTVEGCIESSDITMSKKLKSNETVLVGYKPQNIGDVEYYDKSEILTASGNWTVPDGVTSVRVVLIGGGQGGQCGNKGEGSKQVTASFSGGLAPAQYSGYGVGLAGKGGSGGNGGHGGKVFQTNISVTAGQVFAFSIGQGGEGAAFSTSMPNGTEGGNTTFGDLTSASGTYSDSGFIDTFTGTTYAEKGQNGLPGGNGTGGANSYPTIDNVLEITIGNSIVDEDGVTWRVGSTQTDSGAIAQEHDSVSGDGNYDNGFGQANASAQCGSGAAAGTNGTNGTAMGTASARKSGSTIYVSATGVSALSGATPSKVPKTASIGRGGRGGYGGGGASGHGLALVAKRTGSAVSNVSGSAYGGGTADGGNGGKGGRGGDGCVILYYSQPKESSMGGAFRDKNNKLFLDKFGRQLVV